MSDEAAAAAATAAAEPAPRKRKRAAPAPAVAAPRKKVGRAPAAERAVPCASCVRRMEKNPAARCHDQTGVGKNCAECSGGSHSCKALPPSRECAAAAMRLLRACVAWQADDPASVEEWSAAGTAAVRALAAAPKSAPAPVVIAAGEQREADPLVVSLLERGVGALERIAELLARGALAGSAAPGWEEEEEEGEEEDDDDNDDDDH